MKHARNNYRTFTILLIPASSPAKRLTHAFADPDHAALCGAGQARTRYPAEAVEVVVIRTATREAVACALIQPLPRS